MKALILRSYGVGNAPQNKAFLQELQEASDRGIVVVNLTQCMSGKVNMGGYATGNALAHAGVIGGADMTVEATLTKLHYLLSRGTGYRNHSQGYEPKPARRTDAG